MSLFSKGGTTSPDVFYIIILVIFCFISSLLNPLVFLYNFRKPKSLPKIMFEVLSVLDFLTCLVLPINSIHAISKIEEPQCGTYTYDNATFYAYCHPDWFPTIGQKLLSIIIWMLSSTPSCVTAILTVCRFVQIKFPFRPI